MSWSINKNTEDNGLEVDSRVGITDSTRNNIVFRLAGIMQWDTVSHEKNDTGFMSNIWPLRTSIVDSSYQKILDDTLVELEEKIVGRERKRRYKHEIVYVPELADKDTSKKEVWNRWVQVPFLEDRMIEIGSNYKIIKKDAKKKEVVNVEDYIDVELPLDPIKIEIALSSDLILYLTALDSRKHLDYIIRVIDSIQLLVDQEVNLHIYVEKWREGNISIAQEHLHLKKLQSKVEVFDVESFSDIPKNSIFISANNKVGGWKWVTTNDFAWYKWDIFKNYLDVSWSILRIKNDLVESMTTVIDKYFI